MRDPAEEIVEVAPEGEAGGRAQEHGERQREPAQPRPGRRGYVGYPLQARYVV
jgi:hypothetical protein